LNDPSWDLKTLFAGLKEHKELRTIGLMVGDEAFGPHYCYLRELLYTDGSTIKVLYSLNRFYRGSVNLVAESPKERASLVKTAFMKSAFSNFQRSALLSAHHVDVLCELVQDAQLDELNGVDFASRKRPRPPCADEQTSDELLNM
jgi:hypothetical protein